MLKERAGESVVSELRINRFYDLFTTSISERPRNNYLRRVRSTTEEIIGGSIRFNKLTN